MKIIYLLFELAASVVDVTVMFLFFRAFFQKWDTVNKKWEYAAFALVLGWICLMNTVELFSFANSYILMIVIMTITTFIYHSSFIESFSVTCFYFVLTGCVDFSVYAVLGIILKSPDPELLFLSEIGLARSVWALIAKPLLIFAYLFLKKVLAQYNIRSNYYRFLAIIAFAGSISIYALFQFTLADFVSSLVLTWLSLTVILLLLLCVLINFDKARREADRNRLLEQNYMKIKEDFALRAKLFHDMDSHFNLVYHMLNTGNLEEAKHYISDMKKGYSAISEKKWTGANAINIILNTMLEKAKSNSIFTNLNVDFPPVADISDHDLCIILSNLLNNAIEACIRIPEPEKRYLYVGMRLIHNAVVLKIENSNNQVPVQMRSSFLSIKRDSDLHGFGIENVRSCVEKYNGMIHHDFRETHCEVIVTLFLSRADASRDRSGQKART